MRRAILILGLMFAAALPASASADVLYDQSATLESNHAVASQGGTAQAADDFTVPVGLPWSVASIEVAGDSVSDDTMSVFVYIDAGGFPGPQIFAQAGLPIPSGPTSTPYPQDYTVSGLVLPPGHYWLSLQVQGPGVWDWYPVTPVRGEQAVYQDPDSGPCLGHWGRLSTCGLASPATNRDLSFKLLGSVPVLPAQTETPKCKKKKKKHRIASSAKKKHKKCKKHKHSHK